MTQDDLNLVLDALKFCHGGEPCGTAEAIAVVEKALAQRTWVGLIDKDMNEPKTHIFDFIAGARWAESILKERNT
jgi:hypothetical protein